MQADAPLGVAGDVARDDVGSSRAVAIESFFGRERMIPAAHFSAIQTPFQVYVSEGGVFHVHFGTTSAEFSLWTTEHGMEEMIGALLAALVRARIARERAA